MPNNVYELEDTHHLMVDSEKGVQYADKYDVTNKFPIEISKSISPLENFLTLSNMSIDGKIDDGTQSDIN